MRASEDPAGQAFTLTNQSEEKVLGLDRDAAELTRLVPREEKDPPRSFRIAFEHPGLPMVIGRCSMLIIRQRHGDLLRLSEAFSCS